MKQLLCLALGIVCGVAQAAPEKKEKNMFYSIEIDRKVGPWNQRRDQEHDIRIFDRHFLCGRLRVLRSGCAGPCVPRFAHGDLSSKFIET